MDRWSALLITQASGPVWVQGTTSNRMAVKDLVVVKNHNDNTVQSKMVAKFKLEDNFDMAHLELPDFLIQISINFAP